jgi:integrase
MPKKIILSKTNEKAIKEFEIHLKSKNITNVNNLRTYTSACRIIFDITKKDWNKLTEKDIDKAFASDRLSPKSKELYKMKFVNFLEYKKKKELANYVRSLFNFDVLKKPTKTIDDVLSKEEIKKLIDSAKNLRDKAIMKDIEITEAIIWVKIDQKNTKTKERRIPLVANKDIETAIYPENLVSYYNSHIFKDDPEKPFFYSHYSNRYGKPLVLDSINEIIKAIVKRAKLNKNITPHILRHTGATYDGYYLTEADLTQKYGFSPKTAKLYCHITDTHLGDHLLKLSGTTKDQIQKDSICPRCKHKININDKICLNCNYTLDRTLQQIQIDKLTKEKEELTKLKTDIFRINTKYNKEIKELKKIVEKSKNDFNIAIKEFSNVVNKVWFSSNTLHRKELKKMDLKYKKL